jgi:exodeoxyribonuclease VII large subunit
LAEAARSNKNGGNVAEFSVSELSSAVKKTLEGTFGYVRLRGEISGYRGPHASGHCYFALKDDKSKIEAVIWRGVFGALRFKPEEGMEVIATGKVTTYPGSSKYQIVIEALEPAGAGALMALLEERKRKLAAEGLFDEERKQLLPFLPRVVGIVTSPTGAVIRDMLHGFDERFPTRVILWPVRVQGETCAAEVAAAIRGFNALAIDGRIPRPDVLIVARGGGSLEDLWGFNEEIVVRAAAESMIPLISAVGHETDWTLIDLAADARAPTPTKAAEWAVPKYSELIEQTSKLTDRLHVGVRRSLEGRRTSLRAAARGLPRLQDLVALPRQRLDAAAQRLDRGLVSQSAVHARRLARFAPRLQPQLVRYRIERSRQRLAQAEDRKAAALGRFAVTLRRRQERAATRLSPQLVATRIDKWRQRLDGQSKMLVALSYQSVLKRGYAVVRDEAGRMVRSRGQVTGGMMLDIEVADGHVAATAIGDEPPAERAKAVVGAQAARSSGARDGRATRKSGGEGGPQGSLF